MATVIGALLVVVIFFTIFGVFLTQTIPIWMGQNETSWTNSGEMSMAAFKTDVDLQYSLGASPVYSVPFSLSSSGVPVLASPTQGSLLFTGGGSTAYANLTISAGPGTIPYAQNVSTGTLTMNLPNRYASPETLAFQNDAVIRVPNGAPPTIAFSPLFALRHMPGNTSLALVLLNTVGAERSTSAPGTQPVSSTLLARSVITTHDLFGANGSAGSFGVTLRIGSIYACAWEEYFANALSVSGIAPGSYTLSGPTTGCAGTVLLTLTSVSFCTLYLAEIDIAVGSGSP
ncbi:MAG: hypothetical protein HKL79_03130 [Thermoplasmata archaeon]|nr:hypothetical protein [Thermoplasmata archaeon]